MNLGESNRFITRSAGEGPTRRHGLSGSLDWALSGAGGGFCLFVPGQARPGRGSLPGYLRQDAPVPEAGPESGAVRIMAFPDCPEPVSGRVEAPEVAQDFCSVG